MTDGYQISSAVRRVGERSELLLETSGSRTQDGPAVLLSELPHRFRPGDARDAGLCRGRLGAVLHPCQHDRGDPGRSRRDQPRQPAQVGVVLGLLRGTCPVRPAAVRTGWAAGHVRDDERGLQRADARHAGRPGGGRPAAAQRGYRKRRGDDRGRLRRRAEDPAVEPVAEGLRRGTGASPADASGRRAGPASPAGRSS
jgi:hypothetical protein